MTSDCSWDQAGIKGAKISITGLVLSASSPNIRSLILPESKWESGMYVTRARFPYAYSMLEVVRDSPWAKRTKHVIL